MITIVNLAIQFLLPMYLQVKMKEDIGIVSGVNIIGSADGPTSIYLSGPGNSYMTVILGLISLTGIIYLVITRRHKA
jgi:Na+-transporting methylmalonyl-CoA/oxaloacetate decarboxylase beta subunit